MEKWKDKEIKCENCDAEFSIQFNSDDTLSFCPFCGHDLEDGHHVEDDDDDE